MVAEGRHTGMKVFGSVFGQLPFKATFRCDLPRKLGSPERNSNEMVPGISNSATGKEFPLRFAWYGAIGFGTLDASDRSSISAIGYDPAYDPDYKPEAHEESRQSEEKNGTSGEDAWEDRVLPQASWLGIPKEELSVEFDITVGVITRKSLLSSEPGLMFNPSGKILIRKGNRQYKALEKGCVLVWTRIEGGKDNFACPQEFDWQKDKSLTAETDLSGWKQISLQKKGGGDIFFTEATALAACSNVLTFDDAGSKRAFIIVVHDFNLTDTQHGGAGTNNSYSGKKIEFLPYDRASLTRLATPERKGDPLYETATWLLRRFDGVSIRERDESKQDSEEKEQDPGPLPPFSGALVGSNELRIRNPNSFSVKAGLRSGGKGKDIDVKAKGVASVYVPDGKYDIYFVYSDKPDALFQGDSFSLSGNGVEIQIVQVVNGNYGIRQVK